MKNIALRLRYDGSRYHGWQVQKNAITVAQTMEEALAKVCGERVKLTGCGRTDAGVHALRYCANFHSDCTVPVDRMPLPPAGRYRRGRRGGGAGRFQRHRLLREEGVCL